MEEIGMGSNWGYLLGLFLLGGTNIWTVVMYFLERGKRQQEVRGTAADVDHKEFETMRDQFEVFDKRLENYSSALLAAESTIKELRDLNDELQKDKLDMGLKIFKLEQASKQKDEELVRYKDLTSMLKSENEQLKARIKQLEQ